MLWVHNNPEAKMTTHELAQLLLTHADMPVNIVAFSQADGYDRDAHVGSTVPQLEIWARPDGTRQVMIAAYTEED